VAFSNLAHKSTNLLPTSSQQKMALGAAVCDLNRCYKRNNIHTLSPLIRLNILCIWIGQIPDFNGKNALVGHCESLVCCRFYIVLSRGADLTVLHLSSLQQDSVHDNQPDVTPWSSKKEETNDKKSRKISCSE
jgi:hypothetical protein